MTFLEGLVTHVHIRVATICLRIPGLISRGKIMIQGLWAQWFGHAKVLVWKGFFVLGLEAEREKQLPATLMPWLSARAQRLALPPIYSPPLAHTPARAHPHRAPVRPAPASWCKLGRVHALRPPTHPLPHTPPTHQPSCDAPAPGPTHTCALALGKCTWQRRCMPTHADWTHARACPATQPLPVPHTRACALALHAPYAPRPAVHEPDPAMRTRTHIPYAGGAHAARQRAQAAGPGAGAGGSGHGGHSERVCGAGDRPGAASACAVQAGAGRPGACTCAGAAPARTFPTLARTARARGQAARTSSGTGCGRRRERARRAQRARVRRRRPAGRSECVRGAGGRGTAGRSEPRALCAPRLPAVHEPDPVTPARMLAPSAPRSARARAQHPHAHFLRWRGQRAHAARQRAHAAGPGAGTAGAGGRAQRARDRPGAASAYAVHAAAGTAGERVQRMQRAGGAGGGAARRSECGAGIITGAGRARRVRERARRTSACRIPHRPGSACVVPAPTPAARAPACAAHPPAAPARPPRTHTGQRVRTRDSARTRPGSAHTWRDRVQARAAGRAQRARDRPGAATAAGARAGTIADTGRAQRHAPALDPPAAVRGATRLPRLAQTRPALPRAYTGQVSREAHAHLPPAGPPRSPRVICPEDVNGGKELPRAIKIDGNGLRGFH
ncbi:hypothetical protein GGX14DRAFT_405046 [Mycena pura]|uniref:Uncharacterized protein n=1 Tax=Mycena pura TaxID=153505 RepID=A0AAD6UT64_9AGAR|nr:hypothetical protein GGX14DRAFT_405046 [Mycena pura]